MTPRTSYTMQCNTIHAPLVDHSPLAQLVCRKTSAMNVTPWEDRVRRVDEQRDTYENTGITHAHIYVIIRSTGGAARKRRTGGQATISTERLTAMSDMAE